MKYANLVDAALSAIASHRDLIAEAFSHGPVLRTADNARAIQVLHQHRLLTPDGAERFRLSSPLNHLLREITLKQAMYDEVGDRFGALNERIFNLRQEFSIAIKDGRTDDADAVASEYYDACADLSDMMSSSINKLLVHAESHFAAVKSLAAKQRQNLHFLKQADAISNAISSIASRADFLDIYDDDPLYEPIVEPYKRLVSRRISTWATEVLRVTSILKSYLYRLRQIEPDVKRIRAMAEFLHRNPGYEPPEYADGPGVPYWLDRDPGHRIEAHADVRNETLGPELEGIARKVPAPKVAVVVERPAGTLQWKASESGKARIVVPVHVRELEAFASSAINSDAAISARDWKRSHPALQELADDVWLFLVLQSRGSARPPFRHLMCRLVEYRGASPLSCNLYVRDILAHGRENRS